MVNEGLSKSCQHVRDPRHVASQVVDAKLFVVDGAKPADIKLKLPLIVGRSRSAKIKVPQSQVSRKHCEIYEESGMLVVHDLGSSNGTYISGERIDEPTFLLPGETLQIGKVLFQADYEAPELDIEETEIEFVMDEESEDESNPETKPSTANNEKVDEVNVADMPVIDRSDAPGPSVSPSEVNLELDYEESSDGSFLGIPDLELGQEVSRLDSASQVSIDDGLGSESPEVDPGDSALNKFFDSLD